MTDNTTVGENQTFSFALTVIPEEVYKELHDVDLLKVPDQKLFGVDDKIVLTVVGMFTPILR